MKVYNVPEGFIPLDRDSAFSDLTGPYYEQIINGKHCALALQMQDQHLNKRYIVHGGLYMTLADNAFGDAILAHYGPSQSFVTTSFTGQFMAASKKGDWLVATVDIVRGGRTMVFAECKIKNLSNDKIVFNSQGTFMLIKE